MGTSRNVAQLHPQDGPVCQSRSAEANRAGTSGSGAALQEQALRNVTTDTGGDRSMSNFKGGKVRMGSATSFQRDTRTHSPSCAHDPMGSGPARRWLCSAPDHPRKGRGRVVAERRRALKRLARGFAAYANHPWLPPASARSGAHRCRPSARLCSRSNDPTTRHSWTCSSEGAHGGTRPRLLGG